MPPGESGEFDGFDSKGFEDLDTEENADSQSRVPETDADRGGPRIRLKMRYVPLLGGLIKYVCMSAELQYAVYSHAVIIAGRDVALNRMETGIYTLEAGVLPDGGAGAEGAVGFFGDEDE